MNETLQHLAHFFYSMGGLGLLLLGTLDSSFLMLPLGNDLLLVALTAAHRGHVVYYVLMAVAGSLCGVSLIHIVSSKIGRQAIEGDKKSRQVSFVEEKVKKYGGLAIGLAALAPPGFPFTAFIVIPAALQFPLRRMLMIIGICRALRFSVEAGLAIVYGRRILEMAKSPALQTFLIVLIVVSITGSAFSIYGWIQKGKRARKPVS